MTDIVPTVFAISCSRPTALCASQPSLLSCFHLSSFVLHFFQVSPFFLQFSLFSPFSLFPSLFLFSHNFQQLSFTYSHFPLFPTFFGQSDASPCDPLLTEMTGSHKRTRHVVKQDFACWAHPKKGSKLHEKTKNHQIRTLQQEGPNLVKNAAFQLTNVPF